MPSVLQEVFTGNSTCSDNSTDCCHDCLGMSDQNYNLLYAIYAWTNAIMVIFAGFLVDKLGNKVGALLFSGLCVVGSCTFALAVFFKGTAAMLPIMLIGRLIFGSGNGSLTIVQNRITSYWFKDKELALAFGITLSFSRLGSVLNFFLTQHFENRFGLAWTLWGGAMLCGMGFLSSITVSYLDHRGMKELGEEGTTQSEAKKLKVSDIGKFSSQYWIIAFMIMFFYNGVFPFVADASKFIQNKYGYEKATSAYMAGAVYDVSMIISPFLGGVIDVIGKRGYLALACSILTIPVFGLLAFTYVHPLVLTLWLGFTYSFAAATMWPSIPLVVSQATIGTAMGLTTSIQMIGIGISNLVVGAILGHTDDPTERLKKWKYVMIYLLANSLACVASCVLINLVDLKKGGLLNQSRREKQLKEQLAENEEDEPSESDPLLSGNRSSINT